MPLSVLASHVVFLLVLPAIALGCTWVLVLAERKQHTPDPTPLCGHGWAWTACPVSWGQHNKQQHGDGGACFCDPFTYECLVPAGHRQRQDGALERR